MRYANGWGTSYAVRPDAKEIAEIYFDESSQNNHRFLVLGAIIVPLLGTPKLNELIQKARLPELPAKEVKWTKVSRTKLVAYKRVVDTLFDNPKLVNFHSLVVDATQVDHVRWNEGSREIGFNKEIYQLARKFARIYKNPLFHLYPDYRETNQHPEELRLIVNRGRHKDGDKRDWPFRRCQFRDLQTTLPLQLVDVVIGALAFELNGHAKAANASPAKIALSAYVLERAGIKDASKDTARVATFTIWHRRLQKRVRNPRPSLVTALSGSTAEAVASGYESEKNIGCSSQKIKIPARIQKVSVRSNPLF